MFNDYYTIMTDWGEYIDEYEIYNDPSNIGKTR
jgi:hypothetical protein